MTGTPRKRTASLVIPMTSPNRRAAAASAGVREPGVRPAVPSPMTSTTTTGGAFTAAAAAARAGQLMTIPVTAPILVSERIPVPVTDTSVAAATARQPTAVPGTLTAMDTSAGRSRRARPAANSPARTPCSVRRRAPRGALAARRRPMTRQTHRVSTRKLAGVAYSRRTSQESVRRAASGTPRRAGTTPTGTESRTRTTGPRCRLTSRSHRGPLSPQPTFLHRTLSR